MQEGAFPLVEQLLMLSLTRLYGFQDTSELCYLEEEKKKSCFQPRGIKKERENDVYFIPSNLLHFKAAVFKTVPLLRYLSTGVSKCKLVSFGSSITHLLWEFGQGT